MDNAIHSSGPSIYIKDYPELKITYYSDISHNSTGELWIIDLGGVPAYVDNLDHLRHLAQQMVDYCETEEQARRVQVDAVEI